MKPEQIHLVMHDTELTPNSGPSGSDRQQLVTGNAIVNGCRMLISTKKNILR